MKKQLILCTIAILFCFTQAGAQSVNLETAKQVALHFFNSRAKQPVTDMRRVTRSTIFAQANTQESYFVFEPLRGEGFVIVAGDKNAPPILGYSVTNKFQFEGMASSNQSLMNQYDHQIREIRASHYKAPLEVKNAWIALTTNTFAGTESNRIVWQLLESEWDQSNPYNAYCPTNGSGKRAVTGCVATAMAQVMRYWEWPSGTLGQHWVEYEADDKDVQGTFSGWIGSGQYSWGFMPDNLSPLGGVNPEIARLMLHAGLAVEMDYGTSGSSAYPSDIADAMEEYFNFQEGDLEDRDDYSDAEWIQKLQTSINSGIPVIYNGRRIDPEGEEHGHTWVLDGYDDNRMHMNWGWGTGNNGFYDLAHFGPNAAQIYSEDQSAIFGIVPQGMNCPQSHFSSDVVNGSYSTQYWISAQSNVYAPTFAIFSAGDSITLRPGFDAYAGCTFIAKIGGCTGNLQDGGGDRSEMPTVRPEASAVPSNLQIAPNPFSGSTTVTYSLPSEQQVGLLLMDATGKLVATPLPAQTQSEGEHQFNLEAGSLPAGMYFLVMQMGEKRETKRLILTK
ncbi:MAG: thiol protease/hemagglutinin PrtT [Phycisphaerae bacterium]|nr:thiol protease/hemagglutinin PrtT [Saprospiraceae bacterium]